MGCWGVVDPPGAIPAPGSPSRSATPSYTLLGAVDAQPLSLVLSVPVSVPVTCCQRPAGGDPAVLPSTACSVHVLVPSALLSRSLTRGVRLCFRTAWKCPKMSCRTTTASNTCAPWCSSSRRGSPSWRRPRRSTSTSWPSRWVRVPQGRVRLTFSGAKTTSKAFTGEESGCGAWTGWDRLLFHNPPMSPVCRSGTSSCSRPTCAPSAASTPTCRTWRRPSSTTRSWSKFCLRGGWGV